MLVSSRRALSVGGIFATIYFFIGESSKSNAQNICLDFRLTNRGKRIANIRGGESTGA
jgi:hypothetical protein